MKLHQDKLKSHIKGYLTYYFNKQLEEIGVSNGEALERTRTMLQNNSEHIAGLTCKLKSYLNDLEAVFAVFEAQENLINAKNVDDMRRRENELIMLRARVNNQVLIKNYNLGDFI